ncbi:MAG: hypothetical protein ACRCU3_10675 [Eubacteriaceae bacterium]
MNLLIFEFKRVLYSKNIILLMGAFACFFILSIALNSTEAIERLSSPLLSYYLVIIQFSLLLFSLAISINGISRDTENGTLIFYFQNNISVYRIWIARNIVLTGLILSFYVVVTCMYSIVYKISIDVNAISVLIYGGIILVYCTQIVMVLSLITKKTTTTIILGLASWIGAHIIGLVTRNIPFLSGKMTLIDGNSDYAKVLNQLNSFTFNEFYSGIFLGFFWIITLLGISYTVIKKRKGFRNEV